MLPLIFLVMTLWVHVGVFEQVAQLPVVYQGKLRVSVGSVTTPMPCVVHYDNKSKTAYIVVLQELSAGYQPIYIVKVDLFTMKTETVWHDISVEV